MIEQLVTGYSVASAKLLNMAASFLGSLVALGTTDERMPTRRWMALILFAVMLGYFVPPLAVAGMRETGVAPWLQSEGWIAMVLGVGCIYINRAFNVVGRRFARDPVGFVAGQPSKGKSHET